MKEVLKGVLRFFYWYYVLLFFILWMVVASIGDVMLRRNGYERNKK